MRTSHNPIQQHMTMSKAEAIQMLKNAGVEPSKIQMLENGEMAKTEGEFWFQLISAVLIGVLSGVANAPSYNDPVYRGPAATPFISEFYRGW